MCLPVYRDILFFKDHGKTVGFARICLDCDMSNIVGSTKMTDSLDKLVNLMYWPTYLSELRWPVDSNINYAGQV